MLHLRISEVIIKVFLLIIALICIAPVILVLSVSLTDEQDIMKHGYSFIPNHFTLYAYQYIFLQASDIINAYKISLFITIVGTFLSVLITSLLAYPLSRKDFVLRNFLSFYVFFTMLFSGGIIPSYILMTRYLHLRDSLLALILPLLVSPFSILLIRTFFASIQSSIIESAKIDGAGEFLIFFKIVIPISLPGIATIALFSTLGYWNDWFQALLYIDSTNKMPLQYLLQKVLTTIDFIKGSNDPMVRNLTIPGESARMALCILAIGPIIFAYPFLQRYFIKGLTIGAVKG